MKTLFILTMWKRNERCESRGTSKTSKSYYTFALTQDLLHKSHVTRNFSLTTHPLKIFVLDDICLLSFFSDDFSYNISSDSDPFIFRLTWLRTSSWLRMHGDDGLSKTEKKRLRKCIDLIMTRGSFCIDRSL